MNNLEIYFRLIDRATAPAHRIEKALGAVKKASDRVGGTSRVYRTLRREFGLTEGAARGLAIGLDRVAYARGRFSASVASMSARLGGLRAAARSASSAVFNLRNLLVAGAAGYTLKYAVDVAAEKEAIMTAFRTLAPGQGKMLFEGAVQFAAKTPFSTQTVVNAYQQMLTAGFKPVEIPVVLKGVGDLAALRGFDEQVIQRVLMAFQQIKAKGRLQGEEMLQLAEAGVPVGKVYESIAKKIGKTTQEVRKLQQAGRISADLGIWAVLDALRQTVSGGELGSLMERQASTIRGLLSTLRSRPFEFLQGITESAGMGAFKRFLRNLVTVTNTTTKTGRRIKSRLEGLFGGAFRAIFGPLADATEAGRIERTFDRIEAAIRRLQPAFDAAKRYAAAFAGGVRAAFAGLKTAWDAVRPLVGWLERSTSGFQAASVAGGGTGEAAMRLAGILAGLAAAWRVVNLLTLGGAGALVRWAAVAVATVVPVTWRMIASLVRLGAAWIVALGPLGWAVAAAVGALGYLGYVVVKHWDEIKAAFGDGWDYITGLWGRFTDWITGVFNGALAALASLPDRFMALAGDVWHGFLKGIEDAYTATRDKITGFFSAPIDWAKRVLGIQSPSRAFEYIGRMTALGYQRGLDSLKTATLAAAVPAVTVTGVVAPSAPATPQAFAPQIVINVHTNDDPQAIADVVEQAVREELVRLAMEAGHV